MPDQTDLSSQMGELENSPMRAPSLSADNGGAAADTAKLPALIGHTIAGKFLIESYLGGGGMSHVYKARHLHIKTKVVAIKLLPAQAGLDQQSILRLQQEANAVSYLSHPNIVGVQDFGVAEEGQPYMVMDYFEGKSLDEVIKESGPLELNRLLNIINQTCNALSHAHEKGVVHRDIKPSNIMVGLDEQGEELVKVVDFGIAKLTADEASAARLTQTGAVVGSPLYMSPEQCLGQPVDGRSDIYSLGCVVYECITGGSPFKGESVLETLHKQMNESPPPFPPTTVKDSRCKGLEATVLKMLAKSPANRYRFMVEVATEMQKLRHASAFTSSTGQIRLIWELWKARREARSHKTALLDGALTASTLLSPIVVVLLFCMPTLATQMVPEEVRNQQLMAELNAAMERLNSDSTVMEDIFLQEAADPNAREKLVQNFEKMQYLCKDHPTQMDKLTSLEQSINRAAAQASMLKKSLIRKLRARLFNRQDEAQPGETLGDLIAAWSVPVAKGNELFSEASIREKTAANQRVLYQQIFEASKVAGVVLLVCLASLLFLKCRQPKQPGVHQSSRSNR